MTQPSIDELIALLPAKPFNAGEAAHFEHFPCFVCGYSNDGYYQTAEHSCAARYHSFLHNDYSWLSNRIALATLAMRRWQEAVTTLCALPYEEDNGAARIAAFNCRDAAEADLRRVLKVLETP